MLSSCFVDVRKIHVIPPLRFYKKLKNVTCDIYKNYSGYISIKTKKLVVSEESQERFLSR